MMLVLGMITNPVPNHKKENEKYIVIVSSIFLTVLMLPESLEYCNVPLRAVEICNHNLWRRGVVVITAAQLHSTKPELRFCAGSNPARGVSEIRDGEDL